MKIKYLYVLVLVLVSACSESAFLSKIGIGALIQAPGGPAVSGNPQTTVGKDKDKDDDGDKDDDTYTGFSILVSNGPMAKNRRDDGNDDNDDDDYDYKFGCSVWDYKISSSSPLKASVARGYRAKDRAKAWHDKYFHEVTQINPNVVRIQSLVGDKFRDGFRVKLILGSKVDINGSVKKCSLDNSTLVPIKASFIADSELDYSGTFETILSLQAIPYVPSKGGGNSESHSFWH